MKVTLTGCGGGTPETLTADARSALVRADLIAGAARLLETLPEGCTENRRAAVQAPGIV